MFIVVPVIVIVSALVLSKKHDIFINAMTYMIGTASVLAIFTINRWELYKLSKLDGDGKDIL